MFSCSWLCQESNFDFRISEKLLLYDVALIHWLASNTCMYDVAPFHWFVQNQDCWTKKVLNSHQTLFLMRGWGSAWVQDYQPCDLSSCVNSQPLGGTFVYNYINCNDMIRCLIASATMLSHWLSCSQHTVKRFGLLQTHFGHPSCIPFVCTLQFKSECSWEVSLFCEISISF